MRQPGDRAPAPGALALVQDLANTADLEGGTDVLRTVDELAAFCTTHGLATDGLRAADVADCRELREALRDACEAHVGVAVPEESLLVLQRLFGRGLLALRVDGEGNARVTAAGDGLVPAVAAAVAAAATDGTWARLKACSAHECRWVYYDRSPAGRSRWCTMSICGSRNKMRAYRSKTG